MSSSTIYVGTIYTFYRRWTYGWTQTREATNSTNSADTGATARGRNAKGSNNDNPEFEIDRSVMAFDTSSIPAGATVSAVTMKWWRNNERNGQNADPGLYFVKVSATGTSSAYYNQTYFQGGYLGYLANSLPYWTATVDINAWATVTLATAGITNAGTTLIGCRMGHDYLNGAPGNTTDENYMENERTTAAGGNSSYQTYLIITWTTPPVVTTGAVTLLQPISATLGGNVTDAGGGTVSTRGVCWATTENPTTSSSKTAATGTTGAFTVSTGQVLLPGTLYHYRAYVTTENSTTYGADTTFRTPGGAILFNLL